MLCTSLYIHLFQTWFVCTSLYTSLISEMVCLYIPVHFTYFRHGLSVHPCTLHLFQTWFVPPTRSPTSLSATCRKTPVNTRSKQQQRLRPLASHVPHQCQVARCTPQVHGLTGLHAQSSANRELRPGLVTPREPVPIQRSLSLASTCVTMAHASQTPVQSTQCVPSLLVTMMKSQHSANVQNVLRSTIQSVAEWEMLSR